MTEEIKNKIDDAGLVVLDVLSLVPSGERKELDLAMWLDDGLIIKESSFKTKINSFDWGPLKNCFIAVTCSTEAIVPPWAYLLIQMKLRNIAKQVFFCDLNTMNLLLFKAALNGLEMEKYKDKRVFLKVCGGASVPMVFLSLCANALMAHVKSLFYGEPCSGVPLIKN